MALVCATRWHAAQVALLLPRTPATAASQAVVPAPQRVCHRAHSAATLPPSGVHRGSADLDSFCAFLSAQPLNVGTQLNFMRHAGAWLVATPLVGDQTLQGGPDAFTFLLL